MKSLYWESSTREETSAAVCHEVGRSSQGLFLCCCVFPRLFPPPSSLTCSFPVCVCVRGRGLWFLTHLQIISSSPPSIKPWSLRHSSARLFYNMCVVITPALRVFFTVFSSVYLRFWLRISSWNPSSLPPDHSIQPARPARSQHLNLVCWNKHLWSDLLTPVSAFWIRQKPWP